MFAPPFGNLESVFCVCFCFTIYIHLYCFLGTTYKWYHITLIFLWLISLSIIFSRSIHVAANVRISFFLWLSNIPLYIYIDAIFFIHSSNLIYIFIYRIKPIYNETGVINIFQCVPTSHFSINNPNIGYNHKTFQ